MSYEMRISYWSSDCCSSDLLQPRSSSYFALLSISCRSSTRSRTDAAAACHGSFCVALSSKTKGKWPWQIKKAVRKSRKKKGEEEKRGSKIYRGRGMHGRRSEERRVGKEGASTRRSRG